MRRVVLVRPGGPRNVGAIARAAANFGPCELFLVARPTHALFEHPDFAQSAHGVSDPAGRFTRVDALEEALADCTWSVGFTARDRGQRPTADWREVREAVAARGAAPQERLALVFGSERYGLSAADAALVNQVARIPTQEALRSLNLAVAVALALYDTAAATAPAAGRAAGTPLDGRARALLVTRAQEGLAALAEYEALEREIRASAARLFGRAELEPRDAKAWHAILRRLAAVLGRGEGEQRAEGR